MSTTSAELSSMAATVEELSGRLGPIADAYAAAHRDDLVAETHEIERLLGGALRRMQRLAVSPGA